MAVPTDPAQLAAAARCFQCMDADQAAGVAIYTAVSYANGGVPPEDTFFLGNPDEDWIFGDPDEGFGFGGNA